MLYPKYRPKKGTSRKNRQLVQSLLTAGAKQIPEEEVRKASFDAFVYGTGFLKTTWDVDAEKIEVKAVNPLGDLDG